jgi:hypothetical protein
MRHHMLTTSASRSPMFPTGFVTSPAFATFCTFGLVLTDAACEPIMCSVTLYPGEEFRIVRRAIWRSSFISRFVVHHTYGRTVLLMK